MLSREAARAGATMRYVLELRLDLAQVIGEERTWKFYEGAKFKASGFENAAEQLADAMRLALCAARSGAWFQPGKSYRRTEEKT